MKKTLKWIGIGIAVLFVIWTISSSDNKKEAMKDTFNEDRSTTQQSIFTKDQALKKVKDYKLQAELKSPTISEGTTLLEVYEIRGKIPAIKNLGWDVSENGSDAYTVSYKVQVGNLIDEPKWEVTINNIKALNGSALKLTPELGGEQKDIQGDDFENEVYKTLSDLFKKYTDEAFLKYSDPSSKQLDDAEAKAISETSAIYKITRDEVKEIFSRLDSIKYNR